MEKATIDSIIKEILNYDKIDLSAFYKLSNKYGKSTVLKAFEQLKSLKDNGALSENYLLSKYSDVLILAEVDKLEGSVKDCERFYAKYGKKYVDTFVEHLLDLINPNDEEFAKYEFLINNQYEEEDKENIFDLSIIGNSKVDHFRDYLNYISNFKLLSDDELRELFIKYHNGDKKAEKRINESNLRLVVSIAKKYRFTTYELMDLVQDGNIGLMKAVERFDIDNGCKFSTYATWWIRQAILRGISNNSHTIRIPVHMIERIRKINEFSKSFQNKYGVEPTEDEIASEFPNLTKEDIIYAKNTASKQTTASLYAPVKVGNGETESSTLADMLPNDDLSPEELYIQNEEKEKLYEILDSFTFREKIILKTKFGLILTKEDISEILTYNKNNKSNKKEIDMNFIYNCWKYPGEPHTLNDVGNAFNLTRERIRQIMNKALRKLKVSVKKKILVK